MPQEPDVAQRLGSQSIGVVAIGRNEGQRLAVCLASCLKQCAHVIYVDSGSTDDSLTIARQHGVDVVELDSSSPFTAARARNTGIEALVGRHPGLTFVQVIDADCELMPGWLSAGATRLAEAPEVGAIGGRRRERYPDASIYNRLVDMEWDAPTGVVLSCGGDALLRVAAWAAVGGYNTTLICGEEPELCVRLRARGYLVERLQAEMTLHDADMHRFGQWWKRAVRGGWAFAEGAAMHGRQHGHKVKETRSVWIWGLLVPMAAAATAPLTSGTSVVALAVAYGALAAKIGRYRLGRGDSLEHAGLYAAFCTFGKIPQMFGQAKYWVTRWRGRQATLIEYKRAHPGARAGL